MGLELKMASGGPDTPIKVKSKRLQLATDHDDWVSIITRFKFQKKRQEKNGRPDWSTGRWKWRSIREYAIGILDEHIWAATPDLPGFHARQRWIVQSS